MNKIVSKIQKGFSLNADLIIKTIKINIIKKVYIVFLETLCSSDRVNNYILKPLVLNNRKNINKHSLINIITGPNTIDITNYDTIEY